MTKEEQNRIAVRALAVTSFNAPIRKDDETRDQAMDAIVAAMEGKWPVENNEDPPLGVGQMHRPTHTLSGEPVEHKSVEIEPEFG